MNNYDFNKSMMNFDMNNTFNSNNNLSGLYTGYIRGNMFPNIYDQYRNYQPTNINPRNEKEQYLLDLNQVQFVRLLVF